MGVDSHIGYFVHSSVGCLPYGYRNIKFAALHNRIFAVYEIVIGILLLKDYKNLYLDDDSLKIKYTFGWSARFLRQFPLNNITEVKVVKYSLQVHLATVVFVSYTASKGIIRKKIVIKIESSRDQFLLLLNELTHKNIPVVIEGDYWR